MLAGLAITLPVLFWQIWAFVAPGLYPQEKRVALPFVFVSTFLFLSGAAFGHSVVFPIMFGFFASFSSDFVQAAWTMSAVFGFTTHMILAFGASFSCRWSCTSSRSRGSWSLAACSPVRSTSC